MAAQVVLLALTALPCLGAELAVLQNGFAIRHQRREVTGPVTRLFISEESYIEVATADIAGVEPAPAEPAPPPAPAPETKPLSTIVKQAAEKHRIDEDFIHSVIQAESSGKPKAVSRKGAQGLMQLMPGTARQLGVNDSFDPESNVEGGTRYLRELLEKYNGDAVAALAAYNAGPHRVQQYKGVPPYAETQKYVRKIIRDYNAKKRAQKRSPQPPEQARAAQPAGSH